MATLCKNCAAPLVFDPATQRVVCRSCGSSFTAEEVESVAKAFAEDKHAVDANEVYGIKDEEDDLSFDEIKEEFIDCYIYTCSSCGGEIIINGTDVSTKCIYCGSATVIFDRISKSKAPEFIMPFQITKEKAVELIQKRFSKGLFIPKAVKHFELSAVHGIYVPYWLVDARHAEATMYSARFKKNRYSYETRYFGRSGHIVVQNLPVDGSQMLSPKITQRLEPFDFSDLKNFDEDYLLGFYSNTSDITNVQLDEIVAKRCHEEFDFEAKKTFGGSDKRIAGTRQMQMINRDVRYAMLPVWFVTYKYRGFSNTVLVNGQTGKVVCGAPWNEKLFWFLTVMLSIVLAALYFCVLKFWLLPGHFGSTRASSSYRSMNDSSQSDLRNFILATIVLLTITLFTTGYRILSKAVKQLRLSQSASLFFFTKKRQE